MDEIVMSDWIGAAKGGWTMLSALVGKYVLLLGRLSYAFSLKFLQSKGISEAGKISNL
jgi:hypothetical protein